MKEITFILSIILKLENEKERLHSLADSYPDICESWRRVQQELDVVSKRLEKLYKLL
jgi:exonuclease VII small subunit